MRILRIPSTVWLYLAVTFWTAMPVSAQEAVVSGGDFFTNGNGSASITIGETAISTLENSTNILTLGFQQPILPLLTSTNPISQTLGVKVYPNPLTQFLHVKVSHLDHDLSYTICDISGRHLFSEKITHSLTTIDMGPVASGTHLLLIKDAGGNTLATYQVIKN